MSVLRVLKEAVMYTTSIDLPKAIRDQVVPLLQAHLADAVDLFTQVQQAHWNVKGPNFIALHELFDKIAEIVEDYSDLLAERITALGARADGTARVSANRSRIQEYPFDIAAGRDHVAAIVARRSTAPISSAMPTPRTSSRRSLARSTSSSGSSRRTCKPRTERIGQ